MIGPFCCEPRERGMRSATDEGRATVSGASLAGSAVDLMEASLFRSFDAVNDARFARRLRRSKIIDGVKTSEVHASMRSTACCVPARGGGLRLREV